MAIELCDHQFEDLCQEFIGNDPESWRFDDGGVTAQIEWLRICRRCGLVTVEHSHADGKRFVRAGHVSANLLQHFTQPADLDTA